MVNTNSSGIGSLAWAVANANADPGFDIVRFDIPGACPRVISVLTPILRIPSAG